MDDENRKNLAVWLEVGLTIVVGLLSGAGMFFLSFYVFQDSFSTALILGFVFSSLMSVNYILSARHSLKLRYDWGEEDEEQENFEAIRIEERDAE